METAEIENIKIQIDEIIYELSQCREDDRAGKVLVFQIMTATVTFLTVVMALYNKEILAVPVIYLEALITFLLCAALPFIVNIGMLSTFRHHYIVELERKLSDLQEQLKSGSSFYHWEEACTPFITTNIKKISRGRLGLYGLNFYIAIGAILILIAVYVATVYEMMHTSGSGWGLSETGLCVLLAVVFALTVTGFFMDSRKNYTEAKELAQKRREELGATKKGPTQKEILGYFLYPRIKDCQKALFIVLGFVLGGAMRAAVDETYEFSLWLELPVLLFAGFVIDGLVYQARYLWNDIRGLAEDSQHVMKEKRRRVLAELPLEQAVKSTIWVISVRVLLTILCILLFGGEQKVALAFCSGLIIAIAILYEWARVKEKLYAILLLVCLGYPVRLLAGFWCVWPDMHVDLFNAPAYGISFGFILLATAAFGELFVSMTWAMEAVAHTDTQKIHLRYLRDNYFKGEIDQKKPLRKNEEICTWWNGCGIYVIVFFSLAIGRLCGSGVLQAENIPDQHNLLIVILLMLFGYGGVYWIFLKSNYEGLYTAMDNLKANIKGLFNKCKDLVFTWFVGEKIADLIKPKQDIQVLTTERGKQIEQ